VKGICSRVPTPHVHDGKGRAVTRKKGRCIPRYLEIERCLIDHRWVVSTVAKRGSAMIGDFKRRFAFSLDFRSSTSDGIRGRE
jgi:hypothetical protein